MRLSPTDNRVARKAGKANEIHGDREDATWVSQARSRKFFQVGRAAALRPHIPGTLARAGFGLGLAVEGNDNVTPAQHGAEWANYVELQVTSVMEDELAASALSKAYSKQGLCGRSPV